MHKAKVGRSGGTPERRNRHRLRAVFDTAFAMLEGFFDPALGWSGLSLQHLIARLVRDNFPELADDEVRALVVSLHRAYIERYPGQSGHLLRPSELYPGLTPDRVGGPEMRRR